MTQKKKNMPTLKQVDDFPVPGFLIARVAKQYNLSFEFAKALAREAKRMLYLVALSDEAAAPSARVDMAWHEMMLFTEFYRDFADLIGRFVHHDPTEPESIEVYMAKPYQPLSLAMDEVEGEAETYTLTKKNYKKYFKEKPDSKYWP